MVESSQKDLNTARERCIFCFSSFINNSNSIAPYCPSESHQSSLLNSPASCFLLRLCHAACVADAAIPRSTHLQGGMERLYLCDRSNDLISPFFPHRDPESKPKFVKDYQQICIWDIFYMSLLCFKCLINVWTHELIVRRRNPPIAWEH